MKENEIKKKIKREQLIEKSEKETYELYNKIKNDKTKEEKDIGNDLLNLYIDYYKEHQENIKKFKQLRILIDENISQPLTLINEYLIKEFKRDSLKLINYLITINTNNNIDLTEILTKMLVLVNSIDDNSQPSDFIKKLKKLKKLCDENYRKIRDKLVKKYNKDKEKQEKEL